VRKVFNIILSLLFILTLGTSSVKGLNNLCKVEFIILGTSQDAGSPQIGINNDPAWGNVSSRNTATSAALINRHTQDRYLFEATPDIREQLFRLDKISTSLNGQPLGLSGVFITHAHIGHYAGLMFTGHESAGTNGLNVFVMPRMEKFLRNNGPWSQLVDYNNIEISPLAEQVAIELFGGITVKPYQVPHRDEFSETVAFEIKSSNKSVLFLPDIDSWEEWSSEYGHNLQERVSAVDLAFLDATFFDDNELPGRDMSKIPHPRMVETMEIFDNLPESQKDKVYFIHLNHTNPARFSTSTAYKDIIERGYKIANSNDRFCLD
jgi:pyrroloquinoline quinone biosynthesis protein B